MKLKVSKQMILQTFLVWFLIGELSYYVSRLNLIGKYHIPILPGVLWSVVVGFLGVVTLLYAKRCVDSGECELLPQDEDGLFDPSV